MHTFVHMRRTLSTEDEDWRPDPRRRKRPAGWWSFAFSLLGVLALAAFHALELSSWIQREGRPPSWDQSTHLQISLECRRAIESGHWERMFHLKPKPGMPPFPPLYHLSIMYAQNRAKDQPDPARAALWANGFYMALLCLSLWGLGRHFGGEWAGLGAALLFSCIPEAQWLLFNQLVDLALVAWVAAAYWALFRSERFSRWVPSLLFGAMFAAGMLTKWSAFSYFIPALGLALGALSDRRRRGVALTAWVLAGTLIAPWYLSQGLALLPRLVQASADQAVPIWQGTAVFSYLLQMIAGLGTPFWLLGLLALAVPSVSRRKQDVGVLLAWALSSYAFWTLVPNRQLRYLLPGLPPLAILAASLWPRSALIPLCAYQLIAAANYPNGWLKPRSLDIGLPMSFLRSELPRREDWKVADVLKEAARLHEKGLPFGNLTLVANHPYFNGPTFNWVADGLGLDQVRIRGVNRRLCEFSEFLVVKTGSLGPPEVVGQLPATQTVVLDPKAWFAQGYREARRWGLPDGSEAVLFMRRKLPAAPFKERVARFDYYEDPGFMARDLSIDLGPWDPARGVYPLVRIRSPEVMVRGLTVRDVKIEMEGLALVPVKPEGKEAARDPLLDLRFLRMGRLRLASGTVSQESAAAFLRFRVPGVDEARFTFDNTISANAVIHGIPLTAEASAALSSDRKSLRVELKRASVFGLPLSPRAFAGQARYEIDFQPNPELPFEIDVSRLRIAAGLLAVGS